MNRLNKKVVTIVSVCLCIALIFGLIAYDYYISVIEFKETYISMGTIVTSSVSGKDAQKANNEIQETIDGIEKSCLSRNAEGSDVWRINNNPNQHVSVSKDTVNWIARGIDFAVESDGLFDITIGKITQLWGIGTSAQRVPSKEELNVLLDNVGYKHISLTNNTVKIKDGQALDLGAIGKGIACDIAAEILKKYNIKNATISVGGSVLVYGDKVSVGIIDPNDNTKHMATIDVKNKCISTSGDYERFFEKDGKKYHHIIAPYDGYPASSDLRSVTVVCDSGLDSDALSTICFILGYRKSLDILEKYNAQAVFVFNDNTVNVTQGLSKDFKLYSNDYTVEQ